MLCLYPKMLHLYPKMLQLYQKMLQLYPKMLHLYPKMLQLYLKMLWLYLKMLHLLIKTPWLYLKLYWLWIRVSVLSSVGNDFFCPGKYISQLEECRFLLKKTKFQLTEGFFRPEPSSVFTENRRVNTQIAMNSTITKLQPYYKDAELSDLFCSLSNMCLIWWSLFIYICQVEK